mmetsp:Transcript_87263/g.262244  ORF Transcript_87263/g.262244 Transcript_87263/m.262244 type:complete len:90 (+) Transcript_87263:818-1087(+)
MRSSQIMEVQGLNRRREPMRGASEADRINDAEDQQQRTSSALVQLALVAPPEVGRMQRRTAGWLLRPYPIGLRFSGSNMSPMCLRWNSN